MLEHDQSINRLNLLLKKMQYVLFPENNSIKPMKIIGDKGNLLFPQICMKDKMYVIKFLISISG